MERTARVSKGFRFLIVRGVFPLSFPGVLKISVTFLLTVSLAHYSQLRLVIHSIVAEDFGHMFVEPFKFIARRERKVLRFLISELCDLLPLILDPLR